VDVNVGVNVNVGVGVSVGGIGVLVSVGDGISVFVSVTGTMTVTPGMTVAVNGAAIIGVGVIIFGVPDGATTVQIGNGRGVTPKVSHALRKNIRTNGINIFFIKLLYSRLLA
jgi:hypothetical protein